MSLVINNSLTDQSSPAATLYKANANGQMLMGKPITHIRMNADGTISFDFMKTDGAGMDAPFVIDHSQSTIDTDDSAWYAVDGRRLDGTPTASGIYIVNGKKVLVK